MMATTASNNVKYGDWQKERLLGTGGFGQVSLWINLITQERIAIKMCKPQLQERQFQRWQQEVKIMQEIQHESIVSFRQVPNDVQRYYVGSYVALGMEFCEVGDLRRMLSQPRNCCGLPEFQIRDFLNNIGSAIHFLHNKGIIHRDIKPENIVMKGLGKDKVLFKIIDLGYAKDLNEHSCGHSFVGTIHYLAPEFSTTQPLRYTETVDYWSFGLVAFECITGRRPFYPHFDNAMQYLSTLREKKNDDHICTTEDEGPEPPFLTYIPQPHALNSVFAVKLGQWLQKMLLFDAGRRGKTEGPNDWYGHLKDILNEKHVQICVTHTNKLLTLPVEQPNLSIWTFKDKLFRLTNIPVDGQMLLFKDGQEPDVRKKVLDQCWKEPSNEDWKIFLFSNNVENVLPSTVLPPSTEKLADSSVANLGGSKFIRRLLCLTTNFISTQCRLCQQLLAALFALKNSVEKRYSFFSAYVNELRKCYYNMLGQLDICSRSVKRDMDNFEEMERNEREMGEYEALMEVWDQEKAKLEKHQSEDAAITETVLKCEKDFQNTPFLLKKADHYVLKTTPRLNEILKSCYQRYEDVKRKVRQMHDNERGLRPAAKAPQPLNSSQEELQSSLKDLVCNFVRPVTEEVAKYSKDVLKQIPELVKITRDLPKHVMECTEEKRRIDAIIQSVRTDQDIRQSSLWNIISHNMDEIHNVVYYAYQTASVVGNEVAPNEPDKLPSSQFIKAMNQQQDRFNQITQEFVKNTGLEDFLDLDWAHLHESGVRGTPSDPPASRITENPPQAAITDSEIPAPWPVPTPVENSSNIENDTTAVGE